MMPQIKIAPVIMIFFFIFITSVLCSNQLGKLILQLKDSNANQESILERIIIEITNQSFSYSGTTESRFSAVIKEIGRELHKTRVEAQNMIFFAYANYAEKLCMNTAVKGAKGKLTVSEYLDTVSHIGFVMIESGTILLNDRDFKLPEHYITTFLKALQGFKAFPQCNLPAAIGMIQYCETDACFEMTSSFVLEEVNTHNMTFSIFITENSLKETTAFQNFIRIIFELNQNGDKQKFPSLTIARIIIYGPIVREPLDILFQLMDAKVAKELSFCEADINLLSHKLSTFGLFDEFMSKIDALKNKDCEPIQNMKSVTKNNNRNYQIIQEFLNVNLDGLSLSELIHYNTSLIVNRDILKSYNERFGNYIHDYALTINSIILKCFDLASRTEDLLFKKNYMRTVLALLNLLPKKNFYRQLPLINIEPLYDYFLDPELQIGDFSTIDIDMIRQSLGNNNVLITTETVAKYYDIYFKFYLNFHDRVSYALATFLTTRVADEKRFISAFKIVHQLLEERELEFTAEIEIMISGLTRWDPFYMEEMLIYCHEHRLISKSSHILFSTKI